VVAATVAGNPKAARLGREAFAATLGGLLADRGLLPMDREVLRRLDRVDTVVLDSEVLLTGRWVVGQIWVEPERRGEEDQLWLVSRRLFDPEDPRAVQLSDGWSLGPINRTDIPPGGLAAAARRKMSGSGRVALGLRDTQGLAAIVEAEPELDPLARVLAAAAKGAGTLVLAGLKAGAAERLGAVKVIRGGTGLAAQVQGLQREGHVVAVVSSRQRSALTAADVGVGVQRTGSRTPWGAHLLTSRGLLDAWLVLQAIPTARAVSQRSVTAAAYGSGAAGLLALAGPRRGSASRAGVAVNAAAAVSLASGVWSARELGRRDEPSGDEALDWHAISGEEALARLASRATGLSHAEAAERSVPVLDGEGENGAARVLHATLEELNNPLTPPLAGGAALSAALGSVIDAGLIGSVMGMNALISGVQRVGAHRALMRLMDAGSARVHVRREGVEVLVPADRLVVGDVVVLHAGDAVPADCRILAAQNVEVDESSLSGESQTVTKCVEPSAARTVADRRSMLYAGTAVAAGEAAAVVVATGRATEMGRSADAGATQRRPGGVESRLRHLTSQTVPVALGAGAAVVGAGLLHGRRLSDTLTTGVGLAVAAVPEGLPLVATMAQLASARRLSRRNALVRHHSTIEALGRVDVLCADKTGTLTTGRIALRRLSDGVADRSAEDVDDVGRAVLAAALRATPHATGAGHISHPTDRAVVEGASLAGVTERQDARGWRADDELPFEPSRGYHAVLGRADDGLRVTVKGSPEIVLPRCTRWRPSGRSARFDADARAEVDSHVDRLARGGYRVLAVAERAAKSAGDLEERRVARLEFIGLLAMADPVRASAADSVSALRAAGVEVVMVTGDHPSTAETIAAELRLLNGNGIVTGPELDAMGDDELERRIGSVAVFARVSPTQKVRIVKALQKQGRVVAMTGDGANDAAAIRLADVGVALGARATNAAKEAADVVVCDDRIETIIDAILEGRAMWASVRDAVAVLVGGNVGEIAFTLGSELLLPGGSPLNVRQLLLINLFTDLVPAIALAVRPPAGTDPSNLAREGPEASLGSTLTRDVLVRGAVTAAAGGLGWQGGRMTGVTRGRAGTVALVSIVGSQLGQTLLAGWRNPLVVGSTVASGAALAAVVQTPGVSHLFGCRPLGPLGWGIGATAATGSSLAAPIVHRLLDRIVPPRGP
jgi:cation-transporting ATPase I